MGRANVKAPILQNLLSSYWTLWAHFVLLSLSKLLLFLSISNCLLDALLDTNILGGISTNYALLQWSALSRISNFVPAYLPVNASRCFPFPQCLSRRDKNLYLFINKTFLEFVIIYATWINITIFPFIVFSE